MRIKSHDGQGAVLSDVGTSPATQKKIYKIDDFLNLIPIKKKKQMIESIHPDIVLLVKGLSTLLRELNLNDIDPNDSEDWVYIGFAATVTEGIFPQDVVEKFLEI